MKLGHNVWPRQTKDVVVALHLARMSGKALAAIILFDKALALDHRAPAAVENENARLGRLFQRRDAFPAFAHAALLFPPTPSFSQTAPERFALFMV